MEELERRVKVLEDVEAIRALKARYCAFCDDGYDADGIAGLFTEDAVWDGGVRGRAEGREGIRAFFQRAPLRLPFAIHMVMNPVIEVDGDAARGTWYLFQPCTFADGDRAVWGSAPLRRGVRPRRRRVDVPLPQAHVLLLDALRPGLGQGALRLVDEIPLILTFSHQGQRVAQPSFWRNPEGSTPLTLSVSKGLRGVRGMVRQAHHERLCKGLLDGRGLG